MVERVVVVGLLKKANPLLSTLDLEATGQNGRCLELMARVKLVVAVLHGRLPLRSTQS